MNWSDCDGLGKPQVSDALRKLLKGFLVEVSAIIVARDYLRPDGCDSGRVIGEGILEPARLSRPEGRCRAFRR